MNLKTITTALLAFCTLIGTAALTSPAFARNHRHHGGREAHSRRIRVVESRRRLLERAAYADDTQTAPPEKGLAPYLSGQYPKPHSHFCALLDLNSGKLLFAVNPNTHREPASLTKIMAATVLLQNGKLNDTVIAPKAVVGVPESSLHLRPGEKLSLEDLLYAMLLRSANDTPVAGATYLSGSIPRFVDLMNQKALEEGCLNTHFVTPNGLYDPNHYSTAYDLALMARYAVRNIPMFNEIVKTQKYRIHRSIDRGDTLVVNTASSYLKNFPGADGIKTGYISQAGHCFVGSATRGGWRLIAVALNSPSCREDVMGMLSYGFAHFVAITAVPQNTPEGIVRLSASGLVVPVVTGHDLGDVLSKDHPLAKPPTYTTTVAPLPDNRIAFPIRAGDRVGTVTLFADGKRVSFTEALAARDVAAPAPIAQIPALRGLVGNLGRIAGTTVASIVGLSLLALSALKLYAGALTKNSRRRRARFASQVRAVDYRGTR